MNQERLRQRVLGRQHADDVFSLVGPLDENAAEAFLDELRTRFFPEQAKAEKVVLERKLSELSEFYLTFGVYKDQPLSNVPREYLHWLVASTEETMSAVREYLKLTAEMERDDDSD